MIVVVIVVVVVVVVVVAAVLAFGKFLATHVPVTLFRRKLGLQRQSILVGETHSSFIGQAPSMH